MSRCNESYFQTLLCIVFMLIYQNLCGELYLAVFPEFRFFPEIRKSGSFRFFGRFFIRPRPLVRFSDFKKMLANSRVFHPRKLQTALCKPRENLLCPLPLPNLTISAALITRCVILWRENRHCTHGVLFLAWVEAIIPPLCALWDRCYW